MTEKAAQQLRWKRFPLCASSFLSCVKKLTYRDYHHINQQRRHEGITGVTEQTVLIRKEKYQTTEKECRYNRH